MRKKFDPEEMKVVGNYPDYPTHFMVGLPPLPPHAKWNKPITPKENWRLLYEGKKPYWIPEAGWFNCDVLIFRPRMHPDNAATHLVFDQEAQMSYDSDVQKGWFDLDWEWVEIAGGASVHPGNPAVTVINCWEEQVPFPSLDDLDWEACIAANKEYIKTEKMLQAGMLSGFWERLMSLMDVDKAAMAMIDEDQQDGVHRLFDRLADLYVDYVDRLHQHFNIDSFLIHDDWGTQMNPFFSLDTCREMIVPYLKRVTDACHERGILFELHSCGKGEKLVPAMIEAGVDLWCPQIMNKYEELAHTYKDTGIIFGLTILPPPTDSEEEIRELAKDFVETYKDCRIALCDMGAGPVYTAAVYEYSRKAYENYQD